MPEPTHSRRTLLRSPGLSVEDFRCHARASPLGPEEPNPSHSIVFVRSGVFVRRHEGETLVADANHVLFFNAGAGYRYAHPLAGGDACTILSLEAAQALDLVAHHAPDGAERKRGPFAVGHTLSPPHAAALHYELVGLVGEERAGLAVEDAVAELADAALAAAYAQRGRPRPAASPGTRRRHRALAEDAKLGLNERVDAPLGLRGLADRLGCSPFHLSRTFRAAAGVSLRRYAARLRARVAALRLLDGAADLTALALELGYADHSHFTNAFRREWGVAPSLFRERGRAARKILQAGERRAR